MYCSKCGKPLKEGARFCSSCGAEVRVRKENAETKESKSAVSAVKKAAVSEAKKAAGSAAKKAVSALVNRVSIPAAQSSGEMKIEMNPATAKAVSAAITAMRGGLK